jgi:hypothetical protein
MHDVIKINNCRKEIKPNQKNECVIERKMRIFAYFQCSAGLSDQYYIIPSCSSSKKINCAETSCCKYPDFAKCCGLCCSRFLKSSTTSSDTETFQLIFRFGQICSYQARFLDLDIVIFRKLIILAGQH